MHVTEMEMPLALQPPRLLTPGPQALDRSPRNATAAASSASKAYLPWKVIELSSWLQGQQIRARHLLGWMSFSKATLPCPALPVPQRLVEGNIS